MEDNKLNALIEEAFQEKTEHLHTMPCLKQRIDRELDSQSKEAHSMRRFGWKKVILVAAALCMFGTVATVAAGRVTHLVSSSQADENQYPAYSDIKEAEKKLGYPIQAVDKFTNGFNYDKGNINTVEGMDEENNVLTSYDNLNLEYKNNEGLRLYLSIERPTEQLGSEEKNAQETTVIDGITVSYNRDRYKFYPPNMTPSEEDLAEEAAGRLHISYGSSEIEEEYFCNTTWSIDGVLYLLMTSDANLSSEEMFKMASEVIQTK